MNLEPTPEASAKKPLCSPRGKDRAALAELLNHAAELEHSLCLQYLYASFSVKTRVDEGGVTPVQVEICRDWKRALLRVAREEMLHLGLVCNLLAAIGHQPYFGRPNFPQSAAYYPMGVDSALEPLSLRSIERFIAFEIPSESHARPEGCVGTIGELYDEIREHFRAIDPKKLFVGDDSHQVSEREIVDPTREFDDEVRTGYGVEPFVIRDTESALRAVDFIVAQGEGASENNSDSHYNTFRRIQAEYQQQLALARESGTVFEPARPCLCNPVIDLRPDAPDGAPISHEPTRQVAKLLNAAYHTMLLMMIRFYGRMDDSPQDVFRLQQIIFFPMMTMVLRPLGELLTELPAHSGSGAPTAGATFEIPRGVLLLPHRASAYKLFRESLDYLASRASRLTYLRSDEVSPEIRERFQFLSETLSRLAFNFDDLVSSAET